MFFNNKKNDEDIISLLWSSMPALTTGTYDIKKN